MPRGQAEALIPLLSDLLAQAGFDWHALGGIAVGTGPGNFTGVRIAVAAARGLALGLGVPAVGVSTFEAAAEGRSGDPVLVSLAAPRGLAYLHRLDAGRLAGSPLLVDPAALPDDLAAGDASLVLGHEAGRIAQGLGLPCRAFDPAALPDLAARIARIGQARLAAGPAPPRPAPLYVRPAEAAPPSDPPPLIVA